MDIKKLVINDLERCRYSESLVLNNDHHLFEILRKGETILLINDKPISVVWHDNGPSSGHFYVLNGIEIDAKVKKELVEFEYLIHKKILDDLDLRLIFEVYRPLLKSGTYRFFYTPAHNYKVDRTGSNRKLRGFELCLPLIDENTRSSLYLEEGIFMSTQSLETIDQACVEYYKEQILDGESPTIVTLGMQPVDENVEDVYSQFAEAYPQFILDGHHKSMAYHEILLDRRKKGSPFEVLVPSIFSIVKIATEIEASSESKRVEFLSNLLSENEIADVIAFYGE